MLNSPIHLNPVKVSKNWNPSFLLMVLSIIELTVLDIMHTLLNGSWGCLFLKQRSSHQPNSAPNSFPENTFHPPVFGSFSAAAILSASGSLATIMTQLFSQAVLKE